MKIALWVLVVFALTFAAGAIWCLPAPWSFNP